MEPDDPDDKDVEAFVQSALLEETRSYVERGRGLMDRGDEELVNLWVALVERWFHERTDRSQLDMDDAAAELRLRDIEVPEESLGSLMDEIREESRRGIRELNDKTQRQIIEFFAGRKGRLN